jgi:hypothetical protein
MSEIPGNVIQARCEKCDGDRPHTLLEVLDGGKKLGKVRCNACADEHEFRRPRKPSKPRKGEPKAPRAPRPRTARSRSRGTGEVPAEEAWAQLKDQIAAAQKIPYDTASMFDKGQVVDHPTFGVGVVTTVLAANKIEVLFPDARRKLVCGR